MMPVVKRQQNKPQGPAGAFKMPEPEAPEEEPQDKEYQDFKADIFRLSGLPLPAPTKAEPTQPSKFNKDNATDIDFKEIPKHDDKEKDKKPGAPMLAAPKKESMARLRDIVATFEQSISKS